MRRILLIILLLALFLRLVNVQNNPKSMYGDELTIALDAYSILKTGHDSQGEFLPLNFRLGGGRPGGYVYATIPFVAMLGPNALSARAASVLSGVGMVYLMFLLGRLVVSQKVGLIGAFLTALSPWDIALSRGAFESHLALFLATLATYLFLVGMRRFNLLLLSTIAFAVSMQTYPTYKLTAPLFMVFLVFINKNYQVIYKNISKTKLLILVLILGVSVFLIIQALISKGNQDRFTNINIFKQNDLRSAVAREVNENRSLDTLPKPYSNLIHNYYFAYFRLFSENYFRSFLPNFLLIKGDGNPRHNPASMGVLFWAEGIAALFGLSYLYRVKRGYFYTFSGWILIAPFATALVGLPHAVRSSFLMPPALLLSAVGVGNIYAHRHKLFKLLKVGMAILFLYQLTLFVDRVYFLAPDKYASFWSHPAKMASDIAAKNTPNFDYIFLSNNIESMEYAYPVYIKADPNLVVNQYKQSLKTTPSPELSGFVFKNRQDLDGIKFFRYGNVYIGSVPTSLIKSFISKLSGNVLYIGSADEQPFLESYVILRAKDQKIELVISGKHDKKSFADYL